MDVNARVREFESEYVVSRNLHVFVLHQEDGACNNLKPKPKTGSPQRRSADLLCDVVGRRLLPSGKVFHLLPPLLLPPDL